MIIEPLRSSRRFRYVLFFILQVSAFAGSGRRVEGKRQEGNLSIGLRALRLLHSDTSPLRRSIPQAIEWSQKAISDRNTQIIRNAKTRQFPGDRAPVCGAQPTTSREQFRSNPNTFLHQHQSPVMADQNDVDLDSIIDRLLEVRGSRPGKQVQLLETEIRYLCTKAREIFISQPILLELEAPIKVCES